MTPGAIVGLTLGAVQAAAAMIPGPRLRKVREAVAGIARSLSGVPAAVDALADGWDADDVDDLAGGLTVALDTVPHVRTDEAQAIGRGIAAAVGLIARLVDRSGEDGDLVETVRRGRKIRMEAVAHRLPDADLTPLRTAR